MHSNNPTQFISEENAKLLIISQCGNAACRKTASRLRTTHLQTDLNRLKPDRNRFETDPNPTKIRSSLTQRQIH